MSIKSQKLLLNSNDDGILFSNFTAKTLSCRLFLISFSISLQHIHLSYMFLFCVRINEWMIKWVCVRVCVSFYVRPCVFDFTELLVESTLLGFMSQNMATIHILHIYIGIEIVLGPNGLFVIRRLYHKDYP